ncbi:hypothetical protein DYY88_18030 [Leptolyngbya iicbica LK]|uniref:NACHT C-terminal Cysteine and Histidine-containing domain-containing protein n=1 Tax=Leptolyngbya iicbica LK TaxID=2294035 RepID=A0A4Q7E476_9CYAN|nr:hypothetical protein DYY88_18030 [Leptolyngbya sp. LK]
MLGGNFLKKIVSLLNLTLTKELWDTKRETYKSFEQILFECSERMPYQEFFEAWNEQCQVFSKSRFLSDVLAHIQVGNAISLIGLNLSIPDSQTEDIIAKRFYNRTVFQVLPDEAPTKLKDVGDLEQLLLALRIRLKKKYLAFVLYDTTAFSSLVRYT